MKTEATDLEKTCVIPISVKDLYPQYKKDLQNLMIRKQIVQ